MNSAEIKPEKQSNQKSSFHFPTEPQEIEKTARGIKIIFKNHILELLWYRSGVVRVIFADEKNFTNDTSPAVNQEPLTPLPFELKYQVEQKPIRVAGQKSQVEINLSPLTLSYFTDEDEPVQVDVPGKAAGWSKNKVCCYKKLRTDERIYGLGEKTGYLDKRGRSYTMWNTDAYDPHVPSTDPLYISLPFYIGFTPEESYGIYFDNSYRSHFDIGHSNEGELFYHSEGGNLDYYWLAGPDMKDVIKTFTWLTGRTPLPPGWSLGYHQSRYSYYPEDEVRELADTFQKKDIPCAAIHLDIHYMEGYRVFTWDEDRFPAPERLSADLQEQDINLVTIVDPGVKIDPEYEVYRQGQKQDFFCRYLDGRPYREEVWPGMTAFPDFTREKVRRWWKELHRQFLQQGIRGFWNDMNEPAAFNEKMTIDEDVEHENDGDPGSHKRFHNLYALEEAKATNSAIKDYQQERPFVLTRAGFAGIQRYAAAWTGDNRSFWRDMETSMPMIANMGLSGLGFAGADVGGFTGDTSAELLTRWTQLGVFYPFFRNHTSLDTRPQEPWAFGEPYTSIIKRYIKLRYQLLPEIYNSFYLQSQQGWPVFRPLVLNFPEDTKTHNLSDQVMLGDSLMVAPIVRPDCQERRVYLPGTGWYDFWSGKYYEGQESYLVKAPLEKLPIFVAENSLYLSSATENSSSFQQDNLILNIYPGQREAEKAGLIYQDDGISYDYQEGKYNLINYKLKQKSDSLEIIINYEEQNYQKAGDYLTVKIKALPAAPVQLEVNKNKIPAGQYQYQAGEFEIQLPAFQNHKIELFY